MEKANEINSSSDISQIEVDTSLPVPERLQRFLSRAGDPYQFKIGDTTVHISFCMEKTNLQERLAHIMSETK